MDSGLDELCAMLRFRRGRIDQHDMRWHMMIVVVSSRKSQQCCKQNAYLLEVACFQHILWRLLFFKVQKLTSMQSEPKSRGTLEEEFNFSHSASNASFALSVFTCSWPQYTTC